MRKQGRRPKAGRLRRWLVLTVAAGLVLARPVPAIADDTPFASDPLELIAFTDEVTRLYTTGADVWEVWRCDVADGTVPVDLQATVSLLNSRVAPYFQSLSGNAYRPAFRAGGVVQSPLAEPAQDPAEWFLDDCEERVAAASGGGAGGALIVSNTGYFGGYGTIGIICPGFYNGCPVAYPDNARVVVVGGGSVVPVPPLDQPRLSTVAHEIGHAIAWPHSFGGLTLDELGRINEYDNPMDLMSGADWIDLEGGTLAINRYAAGWIPASSVAFHRKGTFSYSIGAGNVSAPQFLVIPSDGGPSVYHVIGARLLEGYDAALPAQGVEVYRIDQSSDVCERYEWEDPSWPCYGARRRTAQSPAVTGLMGTDHVHGTGAVFSVGDVTVEVLNLSGGVYSLRVSGNAVSERFVDDDGNPHEANIETVAAAAITLGCNPPVNDEYCPADDVTRAQMAAFLLRTIGEDLNLPPYQGYFPDVAPGHWYTGYIERLFELGITTGYTDGSYRPDATVSRAEIAALIVRALGQDQSLPGYLGLFSDVPADAPYGPYAERLYELGVTTGCRADPLSYCPAAAVKRDQMGSFLARALAIG